MSVKRYYRCLDGLTGAEYYFDPKTGKMARSQLLTTEETRRDRATQFDDDWIEYECVRTGEENKAEKLMPVDRPASSTFDAIPRWSCRVSQAFKPSRYSCRLCRELLGFVRDNDYNLVARVEPDDEARW